MVWTKALRGSTLSWLSRAGRRAKIAIAIALATTHHTYSTGVALEVTRTAQAEHARISLIVDWHRVDSRGWIAGCSREALRGRHMSGSGRSEAVWNTRQGRGEGRVVGANRGARGRGTDAVAAKVGRAELDGAGVESLASCRLLGSNAMQHGGKALLRSRVGRDASVGGTAGGIARVGIGGVFIHLTREASN